MARKDKKQIIGEPMTDEQIAAFLHSKPEAGTDADLHRLLRAYQSLRSEDFERFLQLFVAAGGNPGATDPDGRRASEIIAGHRQGQPYVDALRQIGG